MKDLSLSLLSRGCGRFVSSDRNTRRHDARLDVCFTPQDYYIWRSQDSFLQLSNRGRLLQEAESTLPKTYSTRRGPLLLYSQDLVTMDTSCNSETRDRKQRVVRQYTQQVEQQLSTLKELTAAILNYSNDQFSSSRLGPPFFAPLHLPPAPDLHCPSPPPIQSTREESSPELLVQLNPQWLLAKRHSEHVEKNQDEDKEEVQCSSKRVRLDLFVQLPCSSRTSSPQVEPQPWVHYVAVTPEEEPQAHSDMSQQHSEIKHHSMEEELHPANTICARDTADDQGSSIRDSGTTSDKGTYERPLSMNRNGRTGLLPPLAAEQSTGHGLCWEKTHRPSREGHSSNAHHAQHLPPIAESQTVVPGQVIQAQSQRDALSKAEIDGFKSQETLNRLHHQPLFLPVLFPGREEMSGRHRRQGDKTERQRLKKHTVEQGGDRGGAGGGGQPSEKGSMILLEPGEDHPPPLGVMGGVAGWKGPGKQSSLAFLQNRLLDLEDPCESSEANRGVVRGILPLELRDLQDSKPVGCLILGPDGKIIQLSLYDSQDPSQGDGDTHDQALQVLSPEGEKLPWVIVVQPEHAHTEEGVELKPDVPVGDAELHKSLHKLLDLHRSTGSNACSPSSLTDPTLPVAVSKKRTNGRSVTETWKAPKRDVKNRVRMPPLKERVGKEDPNGDNTEMEDEDEELSSTGQTRRLSGSQQTGEKLQFKNDESCSEQSISPNETTSEDAVGKKRKHAKRMGAGDAARTTGRMKTVTSPDSDGQKISRTRKEERWQREKAGSDTKSTRNQRDEGRTNREATEALDRSALPSVKKRVTDRGGARGEVEMNEENEEREMVARKKEESAGGRRRRRRRRGKLQHEESDGGNQKDPLESDDVEVYQEAEGGSDLKSTKNPSATQRRPYRTKTVSEEDTDTDHLSAYADKHSSVQSVSSIQSATTASQLNHRSLRRSTASSCEGTVPASTMGLTSSCGRLSSCSTVMVAEEQLMLNPVKPETSRTRQSQEEAAALHLAQRAERRRQEVERKRREREEEERKQQEREQIEERMKGELEEERRKRAEELRLKKLAEEEQRRKQEEEEKEQVRREQAQRERERRRQEEKRRQIERLQRMREEEEQRRKAEVERLRLEEERRKEEESKMLLEMDEDERIEYLCKKQQEEEDLRNKEEERKRKQEEAALRAAEEARLQAELLSRQMGLLEQQLAFKRGLLLEAGGLEKTQGISRPWIYSYFTLLRLLGLTTTTTEPATP